MQLMVRELRVMWLSCYTDNSNFMTLRKGSQSNEAQLIFSYFELENSSDSAKWTLKKIQKSEFFWHLKS